MRRHLRIAIVAAGCMLPLFGAPTTANAQSYDFTTVDVPCNACPGGIARRTAIGGINPAGDIVGVYTDAVGKQHGFLLSGGQFTTLDVPGALVGVAGTLPTVARGIAPSGEIVGQYTAPVNNSANPDSPAYCPAAGSLACIKGFLYRHGQFSALLFPGHQGAIPGRIAPDGSIYGCFHDFDVMASMFSFTRTRFGYTSLTANGGELADPTQSLPCSMHGGATPDGTVVGLYGEMTNACNTQHGYILQNGVLQTYDFPNSISTAIWDINPEQEMVGVYFDSNGRRHGFVQFRNESAPITFDVPGVAPFNAVVTTAMGVNPGGVIVGQYTDTKGHTHGFIAVPN